MVHWKLTNNQKKKRLLQTTKQKYIILHWNFVFVLVLLSLSTYPHCFHAIQTIAAILPENGSRIFICFGFWHLHIHSCLYVSVSLLCTSRPFKSCCLRMSWRVTNTISNILSMRSVHCKVKHKTYWDEKINSRKLLDP